MNILLVLFIAKFILTQLPTLSVRLLIVNVPLPLSQNDPAGFPNGNYDEKSKSTCDPSTLTFDPIVY